MAENILEVADIAKSYGGNAVLKNVGFSIRKGTIVGLIGANGAGKTTLLNVLSGAVKEDEGDIYFEGQRINEMGPHQRASIGIGRTFQGGRVFQESTVLQNILTGGHVHCSYKLLSTIFRTAKFRKQEAGLHQKAMRIAEKTEIGNRIDSVAGVLAYGQQRKVEIARALVSDPKILLMDEPTAGMSHGDFLKLMEFVQGLVQDGLTVLVVEHNMKLIMDICDKVVVLDFGEKIAEDTPEKIREDEGVIAAYLGGYLEGEQESNARG